MAMVERNQRRYKPELIQRRGEFNSWVFSFAVGVGMIILYNTLDKVPAWTWIFLGFLLLSAISISFGNWMDRQTSIAFLSDGIRYKNGIRQVSLNWSEIKKVVVLPARWGKTVQVFGESSNFGFRTIGQVNYQGVGFGRTGFADGQLILEEILQKTGLNISEELNNAYYYTRG